MVRHRDLSQIKKDAEGILVLTKRTLDSLITDPFGFYYDSSEAQMQSTTVSGLLVPIPVSLQSKSGTHLRVYGLVNKDGSGYFPVVLTNDFKFEGYEGRIVKGGFKPRNVTITGRLQVDDSGLVYVQANKCQSSDSFFMREFLSEIRQEKERGNNVFESSRYYDSYG